MKTKNWFSILVLVGIIAIVIACSTSRKIDTPATIPRNTSATSPTTNTSDEKTGPVPFTVFPFDLSEINYITPLGNLNPPGHTFPTAKHYMHFNQSGKIINFYAPADGKIVKIMQWPHSIYGVTYGIVIKHTKTFRTAFEYFVNIDPAILSQVDLGNTNVEENALIPVTAGQVIGQVHGGSFRLVNLDNKPCFIDPQKYCSSREAAFTCDLYADSALKYYEEPLKSAVYSKLLPRYGTGDKEGKICYDVAGTLSGNWWLEGVTDYYNAWGTVHLHFGYDMIYTTKMVIVSGYHWNLVPEGYGLKHQIHDSDIRPENVTPATGKVSYKLYNYEPTFPAVGEQQEQFRLMIVQMLDANRIKVEVFDTQADTADFTANARIYTR